MKILYQISLCSSEDIITTIASEAPLFEGAVNQIRIVSPDSILPLWEYCTETYQAIFEYDHLNSELRNFLTANSSIGKHIERFAGDIQFASLSIRPNPETDDEHFAFFFERETLKLLHEMHLALEIAPGYAAVDYPPWNCKN